MWIKEQQRWLHDSGRWINMFKIVDRYRDRDIRMRHTQMSCIIYQIRSLEKDCNSMQNSFDHNLNKVFNLLFKNMNKARCIITIGQSNMQWANNGDIDDTSPIDWVYIIGRTSSSTTSTFEPLTPNTNTMGSWWGIWPEVWLAREFKRTRSEDLYIIKVAWSWTQISQKTWSNDWNVLSTGELVDMTKWYIDDANNIT